MFLADVHCHTTFSDGLHTPQELIQLALEKGLSGLSFTDHDHIGAYADPPAGLPLATGVELSCLEERRSVHVLGYGFDVELMQEVLEAYKRQRASRNEEMIARLAELGMPLNRELLEAAGSLGRPQIALALVEMGYVKSFREAFERWIGDGKPGFVQVERFSVREGIDHIQSCRGLSVLAHPHLVESNRLLRHLLTLDFDGIEGRYGTFETERFIEIGRKKGWIITGGSDFHGAIKPRSQLGSNGVDEETFLRLQAGR